MNIAFISTRLAGNDGVSLETLKWATVLQDMGHDIFYCAGELEEDSPPGMLIPEVHFTHPDNLWIRENAYRTTKVHPELRSRIENLKTIIKAQLEVFIADYKIDLIIPQNIFAVPIQLSLALALSEIIAETNILTVAHNHDFYWERTTYEPNCIQDILDTVFPPDLPSIQHVVISTVAQKSLKARRGIDSIVVPNVFDFETVPPVIDDYTADFRETIGLSEDDFFILEPVRIIRRKGIELAIELLGRLDNPRCKFILTHGDDLNEEYTNELLEQAQKANVDMRLVTEHISTYRHQKDGKKVYTLWDAYPHADFVTYPSLYEGFGNALLETIYFNKPALVNNYLVYAADIGPLGFDFVEIDGSVTDNAVEHVRDLLYNPVKGQIMAQKNYALAQKHFSHTTLELLLSGIVEALQ